MPSGSSDSMARCFPLTHSFIVSENIGFIPLLMGYLLSSDFTVIFTGLLILRDVTRSLPATTFVSAGNGHRSFALEGTMRATEVAIISRCMFTG